MVDTAKDTGASGDLAAIDGPKALELLRAAVATRGPDYVYRAPGDDDKCRYVHMGQPSCVVGVALNIYGIPVGVLRELDGGGTNGISVAASFLASNYGWVSPAAASVFGAAQEIQDHAASAAYEPADCTWGRALDAAEAQLAESMPS